LVDGQFGVEVLIPDTHPTTVTSFATAEAAEAWIAAHKLRVEAGTGDRNSFRRARRQDRSASS
jgi:hypothetical protein